MLTVLLIVLVVLLLAGAPNWGYHHLGYWPSGLVGIILVVLLVLLLLGRV